MLTLLLFTSVLFVAPCDPPLPTQEQLDALSEALDDVVYTEGVARDLIKQSKDASDALATAGKQKEIIKAEAPALLTDLVNAVGVYRVTSSEQNKKALDDALKAVKTNAANLKDAEAILDAAKTTFLQVAANIPGAFNDAALALMAYDELLEELFPAM